jgi:hypothetical protein
MRGEHKAWSVAVLALSAAVVASIAIMAQCSVKVAEADGARCIQQGGKWAPDPISASSYMCEKSK